MKKYFLVLGTIASILFPVGQLCGVIAYANSDGFVMGGLEIVLFWMFIAAPLTVICLIIFIVKIFSLNKKGYPIKDEIRSFFSPILISLFLMFILAIFEKNCQIGVDRKTFDTCPLIPAHKY